MDNNAVRKQGNQAPQPGKVTDLHQKRFRPRKGTLLKMQWLAERLRKCERIRGEIKAGTYHVDSKKIARKMLNLDLKESE